MSKSLQEKEKIFEQKLKRKRFIQSVKGLNFFKILGKKLLEIVMKRDIPKYYYHKIR